mgnify:CR=1 FL=1
MKNSRKVIILGYSGHSFQIIEILIKNGLQILGYLDNSEKEINPYNLKFLGSEKDFSFKKSINYFVCIGNNKLRNDISKFLKTKGVRFLNIISSSSIISKSSKIGKGVFISNNVSLNPQVKISDGVILNSGSIIEHDCNIGKFSHIAPGTVLCGGVSVGELCLIGANSVIKEGVSIGNNVIVGAGSVVINDIPNNSKVYGNPAKL